MGQKPSEFKIEELAGEGLFSGVEADDDLISLENEIIPFKADAISITSRAVSLDYVLRRIKNNTIQLNPEFQRNFVWNEQRKSQLIESMMLRIPLPMFYVAEDQNGIWEVVDGLQRLTTIRNYILGPDGDGKGFKLKGLEFWGDKYDGLDFYNLEKDYNFVSTVNNIMGTELSFIIINPGTPEKAKRNIFKRINTGGMRLSDQEIRNALYQGRATTLLNSLVKNDVFNITLGNTIRDDRMAGRELILRYLAFNLLGINHYLGDTDEFLSNTMRLLNGEIIKSLSFNIIIPSDKEILAKFEYLLSSIYEILGEHSFRKSLPGSSRKAPVNKALFELWLNTISEFSVDEVNHLISKKHLLLIKYKKLLENVEFINSISRYASSVYGVKYRKSELLKMLKEIVYVK